MSQKTAPQSSNKGGLAMFRAPVQNSPLEHAANFRCWVTLGATGNSK
jgi:hypothetical protein